MNTTTDRIHTGYGIHIRARNGVDINYRYFDHKNYALSSDDAIRLAHDWAKRQSPHETIDVYDEGLRYGQTDRFLIFTRGGSSCTQEAS